MAGGESVLVVEDDSDLRAFVCDILQMRGFRVVEAHSGWKALQLAESSPPDVLLLDWQLPDITGLDVLRALRASHCTAPAILMTAFGSEELAIVAFRLGVREYLRKPFTTDELLQAIDSVLAETRLRGEYELLRQQLNQATRQLDMYLQQKAVIKTLLGKLAFLTGELQREKGENWEPRVKDMRKCILQIAEALESQPPASKR